MGRVPVEHHRDARIACEGPQRRLGEQRGGALPQRARHPPAHPRRSPRNRGVLRPGRPAAVRQRLSAQPRWDDAALVRPLHPDASQRLRDALDVRRGRRLAADLRRAGAVVRRGRARDRGRGRRRGPAPHQHAVPARLRLPDAQDPADVPRPVVDRAARREAGADRTESYPTGVVPVPGGRNSTPNPAYDGGRGYLPVGAVGRPDIRTPMRGKLELHPRLPRAGQVQRAEDAGGCRGGRRPRHDPGRGHQGAGRR